MAVPFRDDYRARWLQGQQHGAKFAAELANSAEKVAREMGESSRRKAEQLDARWLPSRRVIASANVPRPANNKALERQKRLVKWAMEAGVDVTVAQKYARELGLDV
jgi:hypothetical protein